MTVQCAHCRLHTLVHRPSQARQALWDFAPAESSALMWRQTKHVHCSECIDRANGKGVCINRWNSIRACVNIWNLMGACINIWNLMGACVNRENAHSSLTQGQAPTLVHDARVFGLPPSGPACVSCTCIRA
jgi:hypothetical protein